MFDRARGALPAPLAVLAVLFARLAPPAAAGPSPVLSKHWRAGAAAVRLAAVALLVTMAVLLLVTALRAGTAMPLARWVWH